MALAPRSSTPSAPPGIYYSLSAHVQDAVSQLVNRFEDIDQIVDRELTEPHVVIRDPSKSRQDKTNIHPIVYKEEDKKAFTRLIREHHEDEFFSYLGDQSCKRYWRIAFDALARTWGRANIWYPDDAQVRIRAVGDMCKDIGALADNAVDSKELPRYVEAGIQNRVRALDSFLNTYEVIMARHDERNSDGKRPRMFLFDWREQAKQRRTPLKPVLAYPARSQGILAALNDDGPLVGIISIATVVATAFAFTAFYGTDAWDKNNFSQSDLFNLIQGTVLSTLGLGLTVLPLVQERSLGKYASGWVGLLAIASLVTGVSAPSLYYLIGPAWCNVLAFTSAVFQVFITLQLLQALRKANIA